MAIVKVVKYGEKVLRTPAKEVVKISSKIHTIIDNLLDTMYSLNGVGLAAPQIGHSYRVFVIDTSTDDEPLNPIVFVNPRIVKRAGAISSYEGCLSFPDAYTDVRRYSNVTIRAKDRKGRTFQIEAEDGSLLARAIQHENDHLDGILFIDHTRNRFELNQELAKHNLQHVDPEYLIDEEILEEEISKQEKAKATITTEN